MANFVKVRSCTFIPQAEVYFETINDPNHGSCDVYYLGDNREFDPYTASGAGYPNSDKFRTAQEIWVDFTNKTVQPFKNTGKTHKKTVCSDGYQTIEELQADSSCISISGITWYTEHVEFVLTVSCKNPFVWYSAAIDYQFTVAVFNSGRVTLTGQHDAFPAYEVYKSVDSNGWQTVYQWDPRPGGYSYLSLEPPMDVYAEGDTP